MSIIYKIVKIRALVLRWFADRSLCSLLFAWFEAIADGLSSPQKVRSREEVGKKTRFSG